MGAGHRREIVGLLSNRVTWQNCCRAKGHLAPAFSYRGGGSRVLDCVKLCVTGLPRGNQARGIPPWMKAMKGLETLAVSAEHLVEEGGDEASKVEAWSLQKLRCSAPSLWASWCHLWLLLLRGLLWSHGPRSPFCLGTSLSFVCGRQNHFQAVTSLAKCSLHLRCLSMFPVFVSSPLLLCCCSFTSSPRDFTFWQRVRLRSSCGLSKFLEVVLGLWRLWWLTWWLLRAGTRISVFSPWNPC